MESGGICSGGYQHHDRFSFLPFLIRFFAPRFKLRIRRVYKGTPPSLAFQTAGAPNGTRIVVKVKLRIQLLIQAFRRSPVIREA